MSQDNPSIWYYRFNLKIFFISRRISWYKVWKNKSSSCTNKKLYSVWIFWIIMVHSGDAAMLCYSQDV